MGSSRRLTDQERRQIVRERAKGVSVSAISAVLKVSPKTVYNVLSRGRSAVSANDSRTRVLTMRVTDRDLRGFDAALARRGIAHRSDAMRSLMLAADDLLRPDEGMTDELRGMSAALNRVGNNGEWTEHGGHAARFLFATVSRPSRTAALVTATR